MVPKVTWNIIPSPHQKIWFYSCVQVEKHWFQKYLWSIASETTEFLSLFTDTRRSSIIRMAAHTHIAINISPYLIREINM
jgi:hypothetical protein